MNVKAYLEVTMTIDPENRPAAAKIAPELQPTWAADPDIHLLGVLFVDESYQPKYKKP